MIGDLGFFCIIEYMDSLTQILIGIATVEATAGKKLGNRSYLYGALLGTLPDLDILAGYFTDPVTAAAFHRSFTHSFLGLLVLSPLLGYILHRFEKTRLNFWPATAVVAATIGTHVLIDLFTAWGVQLLYPLPQRFAFRWLSVVDIWFTFPWLVAVLWMYKQRGCLRRRTLRNATVVCGIYLLTAIGAKTVAVGQLKAALAQQNWSNYQLVVKPSISNPLLWQAHVQTDRIFALGDYALTDTQPIAFNTFTKGTIPPELANVSAVAQLTEISEGWYTITTEKGQLYFNDLRFGLLPEQKSAAEPRFVFSYQLFPTANGWQVKEREKTAREGQKALKRIVDRITHRGPLPTPWK